MSQFALIAILTAVSWATCTPGCAYTRDPEYGVKGGRNHIELTV